MTQLSLVRLTLDSGLDAISYTRGNNNPTLPRERDTHPSGVGRRPQLEMLLEMPNLDTYLSDTLMPTFNHPELLSRVQFERTLANLHERLGALLPKGGTASENSAAADDDANADQATTQLSPQDVQRACAALERERALRGDIWNYLNALHQG